MRAQLNRTSPGLPRTYCARTKCAPKGYMNVSIALHRSSVSPVGAAAVREASTGRGRGKEINAPRPAGAG